MLSKTVTLLQQELHSVRPSHPAEPGREASSDTSLFSIAICMHLFGRNAKAACVCVCTASWPVCEGFHAHWCGWGQWKIGTISIITLIVLSQDSTSLTHHPCQILFNLQTWLTHSSSFFQSFYLLFHKSLLYVSLGSSLLQTVPVISQQMWRRHSSPSCTTSCVLRILSLSFLRATPPNYFSLPCQLRFSRPFDHFISFLSHLVSITLKVQCPRLDYTMPSCSLPAQSRRLTPHAWQAAPV